MPNVEPGPTSHGWRSHWVKDAAKRKKVARFIRFVRSMRRLLPMEPWPNGKYGMQLRFRDNVVALTFNPSVGNIVLFREEPQTFLLIVEHGKVMLFRPHSEIVDHFRRLTVLDQLAS
jgi:hypothetical protein